jgi:hypothetical protein
MNGPIPPRLHVLLARDAPVGVVIRRGPSKQSRLILWDTSTDSFTPGQWLKARVYERRCDLSPDGRLLIYFALDGYWESPTHGSYTAVSRPPYFTALGLWPKGDAWHGGGLFTDTCALWLNGGHEPPLVNAGRLKVVQRSPYPADGNAECLGVYFPRLARDGWRCMHRSHSRVTWEKKRGSSDPCRLIKHAISSIELSSPGVGVYRDEHEVDIGPQAPPTVMAGAEWADFDHRGRLVYAARGKLFELELSNGELHTRQIADFNDMSFEAIAPAPWATEPA